MAKVTGVGGVFFKSRGDSAALAAWYQKHLGMPLEDFGGAILKWPGDRAEDRGLTVWHIAERESQWFSPSDSSFDQLPGRRSRRAAVAAACGRCGSRRWTRIARKRQVRMDHGPGREQGRALGAEDLGRQEQGRLRSSAPRDSPCACGRFTRSILTRRVN